MLARGTPCAERATGRRAEAGRARASRCSRVRPGEAVLPLRMANEPSCLAVVFRSYALPLCGGIGGSPGLGDWKDRDGHLLFNAAVVAGAHAAAGVAVVPPRTDSRGCRLHVGPLRRGGAADRPINSVHRPREARAGPGTRSRRRPWPIAYRRARRRAATETAARPEPSRSSDAGSGTALTLTSSRAAPKKPASRLLKLSVEDAAVAVKSNV